MKPLYMRLQAVRKTRGVPWEVLERDYLLSWILAGIAQVEVLRDNLVFKGGTALKKCWFGDYRFSEDLDFTGISGVPQGQKLEDAVKESCKAAMLLLDEYAPVQIACERYTEKSPHPDGQEAFTIRARFPWHNDMHTRVRVEVSVDEEVIRFAPWRPVIHEYDEPLDVRVRVYSLEEIVAEKLRAILQHIKKLEERGWSRSRARDYYDLWRIFKAYGAQLSLSDFVPFLQKKCAVRNVSFQGVEDFFQTHSLAYIEQTWEQWLGPLVPNLPSCATVMKELRPQIELILISGK